MSSRTVEHGMSPANSGAEYLMGMPRRTGQGYEDLGNGMRYYVYYAGDHRGEYPNGIVRRSGITGLIETVVESPTPHK